VLLPQVDGLSEVLTETHSVERCDFSLVNNSQRAGRDARPTHAISAGLLWELGGQESDV
jgi:hypothetical protein